jgi:hypothetical protein
MGMAVPKFQFVFFHQFETFSAPLWFELRIGTSDRYAKHLIVPDGVI